MADKTNGKLTNVEMEMAVDEMTRGLPYLVKEIQIKSKLLKARYDSLRSEGFTEKQAMEIVKTRPISN